MHTSRTLQPHQQVLEEEVPSFDLLAEKLTAVGDCLGTLNDEMEKLNQANDSMIRINNGFGAFLFGLTSHSSGLNWDHVSWIRKNKFVCSIIFGFRYQKKGQCNTV